MHYLLSCKYYYSNIKLLLKGYLFYTMKLLFPTLGFISLTVGAVGIFLPVLPTTPFVLLAAYLFRKTPFVYDKMMQVDFFRKHVENFDKRAGLDRKVQIQSHTSVWLFLIISIILVDILWLKILLFAIGVAVSSYLRYLSKPKYESENTE